MSLFTGGIALASALAGIGAKGAIDLTAASKGASASENAANASLQGTLAGLDFLKTQKAKQEAAAAPYLALGQQATSMLPGAVRPSPVGGPPMPYTTQPRATMPALPMSSFNAPQVPINQPLAASSGTPGGGSAAVVTIQAPDGSQRQVPSYQAQFFVSRGGKVVG